MLYSKRHTLSLPYGFLGDNFRKVKFTNPITGNEDELRSAADEPFFKKPRYLGLGQGPGNRKLNNGSGYSNTDSLSDSAVINSIGTDTDGNEAPPEDFPSIGVSVQRGDFYVRIRDLRDNTYIYFRGYVTGITENVNPSFTSTNYIGRSEPVYLYERGDRDVSFNLKVYESFPSESLHGALALTFTQNRRRHVDVETDHRVLMQRYRKATYLLNGE